MASYLCCCISIWSHSPAPTSYECQNRLEQVTNRFKRWEKFIKIGLNHKKLGPTCGIIGDTGTTSDQNTTTKAVRPPLGQARRAVLWLPGKLASETGALWTFLHTVENRNKSRQTLKLQIKSFTGKGGSTIILAEWRPAIDVPTATAAVKLDVYITNEKRKGNRKQRWRSVYANRKASETGTRSNWTNFSIRGGL